MASSDSSKSTIGRPRNHETNQAVADAVLEMIGDGATLTSLSYVAIARQAGVSRNSLYRRWRSKEELYIDVVRSLNLPLPDGTRQSARENLVELLKASYERIEDQRVRRLDRAISGEATSFPDLYQYHLGGTVGPLNNALKSAIRRGKETGEIRVDVDETLFSALLVAPVLARVSSTDTGSIESESSSQRIVDLLFGGVAPN